MDYVIIGGDERFAWLGRLLARRNGKVTMIGGVGSPELSRLDDGSLQSAENVIVNYPPKLENAGMTFEEILADVPRMSRIYACGPWHPPMDERIVDLWEDETLIQRNAQMTAEGAIASAMRSSSRALRDMQCMIVGWGRIGQALAEILVAMGAQVTAVTRMGNKKKRAIERGAEGVLVKDMIGALPGQRLIVNTAPSMMLDSEMLQHIDAETMLIDLASPPYGIDLKAAWDKGLRAWREPGLPGRYCPESAAEALLEAMDRNGNGGI